MDKELDFYFPFAVSDQGRGGTPYPTSVVGATHCASLPLIVNEPSNSLKEVTKELIKG